MCAFAYGVTGTFAQSNMSVLACCDVTGTAAQDPCYTHKLMNVRLRTSQLLSLFITHCSHPLQDDSHYLSKSHTSVLLWSCARKRLLYEGVSCQWKACNNIKSLNLVPFLMSSRGLWLTVIMMDSGGMSVISTDGWDETCSRRNKQKRHCVKKWN